MIDYEIRIPDLKNSTYKAVRQTKLTKKYIKYLDYMIKKALNINDK